MNEQDKKLCERLNQWGASGHTMELFIGKRNLGHDCMEAAQAIERLSAEKAEILCLVHRDGGHYIAQHGIEKAFTDALTTIYKWRDAFDELATLRAQLAEQEPVGEVGENDRILWADARTAVDVDYGTKLYLHPAEDAKDALLRSIRAAMVSDMANVQIGCDWSHMIAAIDKARNDLLPRHDVLQVFRGEER